MKFAPKKEFLSYRAAFDTKFVKRALFLGEYTMRKFVIAATIAAATATAVSAGTVAPTVDGPTVTVVPAPTTGSSLGGASTWIILAIAAALVAASQN